MRSARPGTLTRRRGTCSATFAAPSSTRPCSSGSRRASRTGSACCDCSPAHTSRRRPRAGSGTSSETIFRPFRCPRAAEGEQISERALEEHLELHWDETPFARSGVELARREVHGWPCRQVFTPVNAIDLLGFESAARRWWVFELKRGRSADRVVGQVSRYLGWIGEERRGNRESAVGAIIVQQGRPEAPVRGESRTSGSRCGSSTRSSPSDRSPDDRATFSSASRSWRSPPTRGGHPSLTSAGSRPRPASELARTQPESRQDSVKIRASRSGKAKGPTAKSP